MKVLMINVVCGIRSTGRICTDLAVALEAQGHEVKIAYGREDVPEQFQKYAVRIGNDLDVKLHGLKARLMDGAGFGSKRVTEKFIEWVKVYDPDVIHLHSSCIWMFAFLSSVILIVTSGQNLKYMLTLKLSDSANSNELTRSSFQFLGVFAYMMVPSFLYILHFGKSKVFKIIVFYLMVMSFLIRGFRFILVAVIIAPVVMVYLIKRKRPKLSQLVILFIILLLMIGFVGFIRNGIRTGEGISSGFNTDEIEKAFFGNFEIFKTYYGIMKHIPKDLSYTYGQQIFLYTLIMFIPRALWPSKPEPVTRSVITTSISAYANMAGTAYPYIGEYYHEFGVAGVIAGCFILGILLKKLSVYIFRIDIHSIILFSSVYPLILQVLIRGYMPSNFYMILFVVLPVFLLKYIDKTKYK